MYKLIVKINTKYSEDSWENVDLGDATIALTYQANDLAELKSREVNRSNRIKLPRTGNNDRLFGIPSEPLSATLSPYRYFDCRLYDNGVELFGTGAKLQLMDATSTTYEVCIKGSLFDFFDHIKDLSIRDIDTINYDRQNPLNTFQYTDWTVASVANTDENKTVVFPLIDWDTANNANLTFSQPNLPNNESGQDEGSEESYRLHIKSQYIFPAVKLSALMDAICMAKGYELVLPPEVLNDLDEKYKRSVLPVCSLNPGQDKLDEIKNEMWISAPGLAVGGPIPVRKGIFFYFSWRNNIGTANGSEDDACYVYRPRYSGAYTFRIDAARRNDCPPKAILRIQYDVFTAKGEKVVTRGQNIPLNGEPFYLTEDIEVGGYLRFWIQTDYWFGFAELRSFRFSCSEFKPVGALFPTTRFPVLLNMPDISQLDLFKAVCQLYGLVVSINERKKQVEAYTFNSVVAGITNGSYLDWSDKLDDTEHRSTFQWNSYGQRSYLAYAEDEGKNGEKLTNRACFTLDNPTLPLEKTLFELPFSACEETTVLGLAMAKIRMVEAGDTSPDSISEPKPKLLYVSKKDGVKVKFLGTDRDYSVNNELVTIASFAQLYMERFVDNYYKTLAKRMLPRVRVMKEKIWLTPLDMQNFTHQKPVYLSKYGCCFYVNKVSNYQPGKLTEVELIAINPE